MDSELKFTNILNNNKYLLKGYLMLKIILYQTESVDLAHLFETVKRRLQIKIINLSSRIKENKALVHKDTQFTEKTYIFLLSEYSLLNDSVELMDYIIDASLTPEVYFNSINKYKDEDDYYKNDRIINNNLDCFLEKALCVIKDNLLLTKNIFLNSFYTLIGKKKNNNNISGFESLSTGYFSERDYNLANVDCLLLNIIERLSILSKNELKTCTKNDYFKNIYLINELNELSKQFRKYLQYDTDNDDNSKDTTRGKVSCSNCFYNSKSSTYVNAGKKGNIQIK